MLCCLRLHHEEISSVLFCTQCTLFNFRYNKKRMTPEGLLPVYPSVYQKNTLKNCLFLCSFMMFASNGSCCTQISCILGFSWVLMGQEADLLRLAPGKREVLVEADLWAYAADH